MFKRLLITLGGTLMVLAGAARAEVDPNFNVVLLTENFPPYNMAVKARTSLRRTMSAASPWISSGKCSCAPVFSTT